MDLKLKKKFFPSRRPAVIEVYGDFNRELERQCRRQFEKAIEKDSKLDGLILLINSHGGDSRILATLINTLLKLNLPCMGMVEDEALSCAADLLLSCQYRVAAPLAKICFHHGGRDTNAEDFFDKDVLLFIAENLKAERDAYLKRFCRVTGQSMKTATILFKADEMLVASRAVELGILHEITEDLFPFPPKMFGKKN